MDFMKLLGGLMGGPKATQVVPSTSIQNQQVQTPSSPTASLANQEHNSTAVAMAAAKPQDTAPKTPPKLDGQANEKQGLLMRAIESITNAFGISMPDLTKLLLKANPAVVQEAVASVLKTALPQQAQTAPQAEPTSQEAPVNPPVQLASTLTTNNTGTREPSLTTQAA